MLWICAGCTTAYAVGLECCPNCTAVDYTEQGAGPEPVEEVSDGG